MDGTLLKRVDYPPPEVMGGPVHRWLCAPAVHGALPAGMREDPAAILEHISPRFDETFHAVTAGTTDMCVDALFDRDLLPFWGKGVVTLLGDAAHPVLPHTGHGAAQAMVDVEALGQGARQERERRGRCNRTNTRPAREDGGPGGTGTPDRVDHVHDEPVGLPAAQSPSGRRRPRPWCRYLRPSVAARAPDVSR